MHLIIFLVVIGALVTGLAFVAEAYAAYLAPFVALTVLYFVTWFVTSHLLAKRIEISNTLEGSCSPTPPNFGYLDPFAKLTLLEASSFYIVGVSLLFAAALLVDGHTFRAWMVAAFGFGLGMGLAAVSEQSSK
jgi:hypothetical protein